MASSSISEKEDEATESVKDLRAILEERSRQAAIQVGIRDVRTYVDPYILARRAVTFFKTILTHAEELVKDNLDNLSKLLSSLADELAASAPSISPAFVIASILQVLYDELTETEADINLIWRAMSKVSETVEEYLSESLEGIEHSCSAAFPEKVKIAVIGGGRLTLHCLKNLKPGSTITILEGYPDRDGVWLYEELSKLRSDVAVRLLPDAFNWQAAIESEVILILLSGVGRDGFASARAGSLALATTAKRLKRRVLGLTFMIAVEPARYLKGIMVPEARVVFQERGGERLSIPTLDLFDVREVLDGIITDKGVYSDVSTLTSDSLEYISQMVGKAFNAALRELGFKPPGIE